MESLVSGTFMGAGSFRCTACGYIVTLDGSEQLPECPSCGTDAFVRASMFSTERIPPAPEPTSSGATSLAAPSPEREATLAEARGRLDQPGDYVVYDDAGQLQIVALTREWTRIGRSLAADVRFDDPTVSRRHALIVRQPDGVRLLDDRSLNGVFVNGTRVDGRTLNDGDEIVVGRYHLMFMSVPPLEGEGPGGGQQDTRLHSVG
ncbi:MAG TPA: FHA domain-containing protein [Solirubrobacteraceae bacterium]|nr:FHA domain-containing protein [Solirubrobacteraceae bacterium]